MNTVTAGREYHRVTKWLSSFIKPNQSGCSIGCDWLVDQNSASISSVTPIYNEHLSTVLSANASQLQACIERSSAIFKQWRNVPAPKRGEFVNQIGQKLREHKEILGLLIALEVGKSKAEGEGEVQEMIDMADFAVGQSRMLYGKTMPSERKHHRMFEQWHPLGPVGVITAFNFPAAVWAWNAFISIICGNTVIWKPSLKTPVTSIVIHTLCQQVMQHTEYADVFALCILGDNIDNQALLDSPATPLISFTGSTKVGRYVAQRLAARMGKVLLECGGNNAMIVSQHANVTLAVEAAVFSAIGTNGQRCTSLRRCYVQEELYDSFIQLLKKSYDHITVGDPLEETTIMGPLIDEHAVTVFKDTVEQATQQGGTILVGGRVLPELGANYVQPTIIAIDPRCPILQHESFVPIMFIMRYNTLVDAINMQNDVPQGLSSSLFSSNLAEVELYLSAMGSDCGIVNVNTGTTGAEIGGAFGGEKETGGGREAGSDAWKAYMRRQTVTINTGESLPLAQGINFKVCANE